MTLISRKQAAEAVGVSVAAIDRALRAGRVHYAVGRQFDDAAFRAAWETNRQRRRRSHRSPVTAATGESESDLRRELLRLDIEAKRRRLGDDGGQSVPINALVRAVLSWRQLLRGQMDGSGGRLADAVRTWACEHGIQPKDLGLGRAFSEFEVGVITGAVELLLQALTRTSPAVGAAVRAAVVAADRPTNPGFEDVRTPHEVEEAV